MAVGKESAQGEYLDIPIPKVLSVQERKQVDQMEEKMNRLQAF